MSDQTYAAQLNEEASVWGEAARDLAARVPPDWTHHRRLRFNAAGHARDIDSLLDRIEPGMRVLELGCNAGWLTIALARRGAIAHGVDVAASAIAIARDYYDAHRDHLAGTATYEAADVSALSLPDGHYDVVVAKGIMHHLPDADGLIARLHRALAPGGFLWISDTRGSESTTTVIAAGVLMLALPVSVSYREKFGALARFGRGTPDRVRASMETRGFSPFEGAGREVDWAGTVRQLFDVEFERPHPALAGYIAGNLRGPDALALPVVRALAAVDRALVRMRVLRSTGVTICARKRGPGV